MGITGTSGSSNTAVGSNALLVTNADGNTAVGRNAGSTNTTGTNNTLIGFNSNVTASNFTNATAIGYNATVAQSNSLVLGQAGTSVGIGTNAPGATLDVNGTAIIGTNGTPLTGIIRSTEVDNLPIIAAGATSVRTYAVANTVLGASVYVSPANGLLPGLVIAYARVSVAGSVEVGFTNTTAGNIDQASQNYYVTVIQ
ncbi:MAG: hypothetical protein IPO01_00290 [Chitinophagaceae bacterium]|nr:hypothetical protein [Chitinophagaceae bacterium]